MRKWFPTLLVPMFVFMLAMPAHAQEKTMEERVKALEETLTGWSIYGSIRFATFYDRSNSDFAANGDTDKATSIDPNVAAITRPSQSMTQWALANNSRVGIAVDRKDNFAGRVELGLRNDMTVALRLGYGTYTVGAATLLFGQDYTPLSDWDYSTQVFYADNNLAGWGVIDVVGKRLPQVKLKANGFQVALVYPKGAVGTDLATVPGAYPEVLFPTLQARYRLSTDVFFADIFGGAGTFKVKADTPDIDKTVNSWAGGVGGGLTLAPAYVKGMIWWARNGKQMSLHTADSSGALFTVGGDYIEEDNFGWALIAGAKMEGGVGVEAGYGYVSSDLDASGAQKNKAMNYYANVSIPVASNETKTETIVIVPEVGVYDYKDNAAGNTQGKVYYAGAKWQVNF